MLFHRNKQCRTMHSSVKAMCAYHVKAWQPWLCNIMFEKWHACKCITLAPLTQETSRYGSSVVTHAITSRMWPMKHCLHAKHAFQVLYRCCVALFGNFERLSGPQGCLMCASCHVLHLDKHKQLRFSMHCMPWWVLDAILYAYILYARGLWCAAVLPCKW
ncbi:hypothetical protein COO60DRAFT_1504618 [Scenedesmus sp. NREL 46B-D3]|nr:hypothetical protein COO60DRAFT_1504618 [Scenedesmus sp. NREL 46B-D3]